jgi:hypothetical protein
MLTLSTYPHYNRSRYLVLHTSCPDHGKRDIVPVTKLVVCTVIKLAFTHIVDVSVLRIATQAAWV